MKKKTKDLLEGVVDAIEEMQKLQYEIFVHKNYIDEDIETFAHEFEQLEAEVNMINDRDANERESEIIQLWGKLQILTKLFQTKKFMNSKTDILVVGKLLTNMAKKCIEIAEK